MNLHVETLDKIITELSTYLDSVDNSRSHCILFDDERIREGLRSLCNFDGQHFSVLS